MSDKSPSHPKSTRQKQGILNQRGSSSREHTSSAPSRRDSDQHSTYNSPHKTPPIESDLEEFPPSLILNPIFTPPDEEGDSSRSNLELERVERLSDPYLMFSHPVEDQQVLNLEELEESESFNALLEQSSYPKSAQPKLNRLQSNYLQDTQQNTGHPQDDSSSLFSQRSQFDEQMDREDPHSALHQMFEDQHSLLLPLDEPKREERERSKPPKHISKSRKNLMIVFAGGKGGVGRSLISANLALYLSRLGRKEVIIADLDPNGATLHTYLGVEPLLPIPGDSLRSPPSPILSEVPGTRLKLCRLSPPISHALPEDVRHVVLEFIYSQNPDFIVLDLGTHADHFTLDTFLNATHSVVAFTPNPCAIERGYGFIQAALYRRLIYGSDDAAVVSRALLTADQVGHLHSPDALAKALRSVNQDAAHTIQTRIHTFSPKILVNQCRTRAERELSFELCAALRKKWRINPSPLGAVASDEIVWKSIGVRRPLMIEYPGATISSDIERLARRILSQEKEYTP